MKIESIRCRDLVDTGSFRDGQDPAVRLKIAGQQFKTARLGHTVC